MKKILIIITLLIGISLFSNARASIVSEDFESYTAGNSIIGGSGGSGWNSNWAADANVNWTCENEGSDKMGAFHTTVDSPLNAYRGFAATTSINSFEFDVRIDGTTNVYVVWPFGAALIGGNVSSSNRAAINIGFANAGTLNLYAFEDGNGGFPNETQDLLGGAASIDTTYSIEITNIKFNTGGGDAYTYSASVNGGAAFDDLKFYYYSSNQPTDLSFFGAWGNSLGNSSNTNFYVDNIIAVVPEPSTYALFGIGFLGLITGWIRKKRKA